MQIAFETPDGAAATVGCGAIVLTSEYAEIKRVHVRPQARGQGLARRLMEALEQAAVQRGCRTLMLETGPTQAEALLLYERPGYRRCGPFGDHPGDPYPVFMEKHAADEVVVRG